MDFVVVGGGDLWMLNSLGKMCFAKYAKEMDIGPWFQELNSLFRSVKCDGGCFEYIFHTEPFYWVHCFMFQLL